MIKKWQGQGMGPNNGAALLNLELSLFSQGMSPFAKMQDDLGHRFAIASAIAYAKLF
jgi:hypothetical protein